MSMLKYFTGECRRYCVAKTKLFNILQDIASGEVYIEQMMNDSYYNN